MRKILVKITNNLLIFKERKKLNSEYKSMLNTNVISCNELLFSDEYMENNIKIVTMFLTELAKSNNLNTILIENASLNQIVLKVTQNNPYLKAVIFKEDLPLTYKDCELITKSYITSVNCYNLQEFMLEILDKHHILVESRSEILFASKFMKGNNLASYSSLFYKITLHLYFPISENDEEDFITFIKINKYLKYIHVNHVARNDLENIVAILKKHNKKNIKIIINENVTDLDTIEYLKHYQKKHGQRAKITFKINYSDSYLKENLIKQTNINILRLCGFIIIFIITVTFGYVFYDNYTSMKKVNNIQDDLQKVIEIADVNDIISNLPPKEDTSLDDENNDNQPENLIINEDVASLLTVNPDIAGWITVNNTNINYPTVQAKDNKFYLSHNIYSEKDNNGWVFIDYRNKKDEINDNLIVYAHNRYYSGVMFGTLSNTTKRSWYKNTENQIITYKTIYGTYKYKIFSIYKIYKTNDYIVTDFATAEAKQLFLNKIKERSIYDFKVNLTSQDKIITLSTCANDNNRIVVHAVLINE